MEYVNEGCIFWDQLKNSTFASLFCKAIIEYVLGSFTSMLQWSNNVGNLEDMVRTASELKTGATPLDDPRYGNVSQIKRENVDNQRLLHRNT